MSHPPIILVPHDPAWASEFTREAARVRPAFGDTLRELHHIGSTSIPGLEAKPIIDMLAVVTDVRALDRQVAAFATLGYESMGEFGLPGRRYFRRDDAAGIRTHQLHAYGPDSPSEIARHLDFRDYLRAHPETARNYARLKQLLAASCGGDMACYGDGKSAFIREVERRGALARGTSGFVPPSA